MNHPACFLRKAFVPALAAFLSFVAPVRAAWTTLSLPPLSQSFGSYQMGHLPDGRLVYGSSNDLDVQTTFGAASLGDYANALAWDPSGVAIYNSLLGAVGRGTSGSSPIYLFNPSDLNSGFTAITGISIQNYSLTFRNDGHLYVGGQNGSQENMFALGQKHAVSYLTTDGQTNKVIIDNISEFSAGFAVDLAGDLYVSTTDYDSNFNPQPLQLYKFTATQIAGAISGTALTLAEGEHLTTLTKNGSLAVDGLGRIWAAGFGGAGFEMYDPVTDTRTTFVPGLPNANYVVTTFSDGVDDYVGYINASGTSSGATLTYGYDKAANLVPEPGASLLLLLGLAGFAARRRRA